MRRVACAWPRCRLRAQLGSRPIRRCGPPRTACPKHKAGLCRANAHTAASQRGICSEPGLFSLGKIDFYLGKIDFYLGKIDFYLGKIDFYLGKIDLYLDKIDFYLGKIDFYLGKIDLYRGRIDLIAGESTLSRGRWQRRWCSKPVHGRRTKPPCCTMCKMKLAAFCAASCWRWCGQAPLGCPLAAAEGRPSCVCWRGHGNGQRI